MIHNLDMATAVADSEKRMKDLEEASRPLIKYIAENYHPHTQAIVDGSSVSLWEGIGARNVDDYIVD